MARVEGVDADVSIEEYAAMVGEAVERRVRRQLARIPTAMTLRSPESVAETAVAALTRALRTR